MASNEERKSLAESERLSSDQLLHSKIQCGLFRVNGVVAAKIIMMMGQFYLVFLFFALQKATPSEYLQVEFILHNLHEQ